MRKTLLRKVSNKQAKELRLRRLLKAKLIIRNDGRCEECGQLGGWLGLELSHTIPLSRGGKTEMSNVRLLCHSCHGRIYHHLNVVDG